MYTILYINFFLVCTLASEEFYKFFHHEIERSGKIHRRSIPPIPLIFPGTKWCGAGNIAKNYDDLGLLNVLDYCCRNHDNCGVGIESGQTMNNLTNNTPFFASTCTCDQEFHSCLQGNREIPSDVVGFIYFNVLKFRCFKLEYPVIKCTQWAPIVNKCLQYDLDTQGTQTWQWFDNGIYPY